MNTTDFSASPGIKIFGGSKSVMDRNVNIGGGILLSPSNKVYVTQESIESRNQIESRTFNTLENSKANFLSANHIPLSKVSTKSLADRKIRKINQIINAGNHVKSSIITTNPNIISNKKSQTSSNVYFAPGVSISRSQIKGRGSAVSSVSPISKVHGKAVVNRRETSPPQVGIMTPESIRSQSGLQLYLRQVSKGDQKQFEKLSRLISPGRIANNQNLLNQ